jgi:hypothetical protein
LRNEPRAAGASGTIAPEPFATSLEIVQMLLAILAVVDLCRDDIEI